jgi:Bacterial aa3 type cytochrome c oxidase subunit IV
MDYAEHERTYRMFLRLIRYTVASVVVILVILALLWG